MRFRPVGHAWLFRPGHLQGFSQIAYCASSAARAAFPPATSSSNATVPVWQKVGTNIALLTAFDMAAGAAHSRAQSTFPVLVVSSDGRDHSALREILAVECRMHTAAGRSEAISKARRIRPWVVICDQTLADGDWRDLLTDLQAERGAPPLIVASRLADDRLWAEVLNLGGYDLLIKPFTGPEVSRVVQMAARRGIKAGGQLAY